MPYAIGPYDSNHLYVQWGGKLPGNEQWSCGFRMRKKTPGAVDDGTGLLVGISGAIATFHADPHARIGPGAKLSFVKVNAIDTTGHYLGTGTNQALYGDLPGGFAGGPVHPNQVALVVSLTTGFSRGPAHKGRFYLPLPGVFVLGSGLIDAADAVAVSDTVDTLRTAVNAVNADYEMAIFSRKAGAPGNRRVTGNLVGEVLDTQRRRRRSLVENYQ
jgi:hypothetical protein